MNGNGQRSWWDSLRHFGLLLSPGEVLRLEKEFPVQPLSEIRLNMLRRELNRLDAGELSAGEFVGWVLEHTCDFQGATGGHWKRASSVPTEFSRTLVSGEGLKPRHLWIGARGGVLPVFVDDHTTIGQGRGRKAVSDVVQWLRLAKLPLAVVSNARQWRLIHAGLDYDAGCEADVSLWFEEGAPGLQLQALRLLLQPKLHDPVGKGAESPLALAIAASRKGQSDLSAELGERVREAVEVFVRAHGEALREAGLEAHGPEIYRAAVRMVMRMVVVLFAESRDLLPRDNPLYHNSYSLLALFEQLQRIAARGRGRLGHRYGAWPRVVALLRLIHEGSHHPDLSVPAYGGELFAPGVVDSPDPLVRALHVFETACFDSRLSLMPDTVVHEMLYLLTRTRIRIRQGRATTTTVMPVNFGDLSSEYVGILYEGLLDYELRTAPADEPIVFLAVGNEPALPLSRLEGMDEGQIKSLLEKLKDTSSGDDDDDGADDAEEQHEDDEQVEGEEDQEEVEEAVVVEEVVVDAVQAALDRALAWTRRAALAGGLVKKPRGRQTPESELVFHRKLESKARQLVRRVVLPGEWYLVRWGGTRKGAGTFYTRPQLAVPTVHRTLRPLAYSAAGSKETPHTPEEILALKVCDPGCGSGSFLVASLRFLTEAAYAALHAHGRLKDDTWRQPLDEVLGLAQTSNEERLDAVRLPCEPEDPSFEPRTKTLLKRYVVERSIYGVDLDPLAVELCRLSLWIETMDPRLPFSFLDHKVKCGNSLVGCWFDSFQHYPTMAWKREDGDKNHSNGVHFGKDARTKALKDFVNDTLKQDLQLTIEKKAYAAAMNQAEARHVHDDALAVFRGIHELPVQDSDQRARKYRELITSEAWLKLKQAFDLWCACWFWPADKLGVAPLSSTFGALPAETRTEAERIAAAKRFFHWELEFPDVFDRADSGFDAVVGNPPWDVAKPNSKEFFSNTDPLYRSYGKQEALRKQTEFFADESIERAWLDYCADFKAQSALVKYACIPYGDPAKAPDNQDRFNIARGRRNAELHTMWRKQREGASCYADARHPFQHQGSADLNLYKLFLEQAHNLLRTGGRLGFLVPSGVYSDHGSGDLRTLFLDHCQWEWLFGFENREGIFDIHRSSKFNPVILEKGGSTEAIRTAFMRRNLADWENAEQFATPYTRERVTRFSPRSKAILEIQSARDLEILEKIYANSVLLGDQGPDGWGIEYAREFDMTNDSKLFPPRPMWEEQGYKPDEYSRWLKGNWQDFTSLWKFLGKSFKSLERRVAQPPYDTLPIPRADIPAGIILSRDATEWIAESEIEETALPLYEGRMIGQFDFSQKGWVSGKGRSAVWREIPWERKQIEPQFLMDASVMEEEMLERYLDEIEKARGEEAAAAEREHLSEPSALAEWRMSMRERLGFMAVGSATNMRAMITAQTSGSPHGNAVPVLRSRLHRQLIPSLTAVLDSLAFDFVFRLRLVGLNLNYFVIAEAPLPPPVRFLAHANLRSMSFGMTCCAIGFAHIWGYEDGRVAWRTRWSLTDSERLRALAQLEVAVAAILGLDLSDLMHILADCDHPSEVIRDRARAAQFNPKGFWRVDKDKDPELRHTVLTLVAFHDLQEKIKACGGDRERGIEAFLNQNDGEGWMLPETLRLADYGLGHDDRAKEPQSVSSRLGPRFYDWQLAQSPEESWRECHLHARNLLGEAGYKKLLEEIEAEKTGKPMTVREPPATFKLKNDPQQRELF